MVKFMAKLCFKKYLDEALLIKYDEATLIISPIFGFSRLQQKKIEHQPRLFMLEISVS